MQSLLIPQPAGQIYAMAGMTTQLNLAADRIGSFRGENTKFNGAGLQQETFDVIALAPADYARRVAIVRVKGRPLDGDALAGLFRKSVPPRPVYYSTTPSGPFKAILVRSQEPTR